jgi:hypothetical protein
VRNGYCSTLLLTEPWGEPSCFVSLGLRQDEDPNNRPALAVARIPKRSSGAEFTPARGMVQ